MSRPLPEMLGVFHATGSGGFLVATRFHSCSIVLGVLLGVAVSCFLVRLRVKGTCLARMLLYFSFGLLC